MRYSLINIVNEKDGLVDGVWIQNHTGTLKTAIKVARDTEKANSNRIIVGVVEDLNYSSPNYSLKKGLKRLDK